MKFKLDLKINRTFGNRLPINYQYELSAAIYKVLAYSDKEYASWLHNNGFIADNKRFKLFCFSRLLISSYQIDKAGERLIINSDDVEWFISFLPEKSTKEFIEGVFTNQTISIGDRISSVEFFVNNIQLMPPPEYRDEMEFETLSPVVISQIEDRHIDYLAPDDEKYASSILTGALSRYKAYYGKEYPHKAECAFKLLSKPKSALVRIKANTPKQTYVRGYSYKFRLKLPVDLMQIIYESGLGEKGSLGFGAIQTINPLKI